MTIEKIARDEMRERIAQTIKAQGWRAREDSYAVADALLPLITEIRSASYRAGAEDMRERAAGVADDHASPQTYHGPAPAQAAGVLCARSIAYIVRSLPLPDPQPNPPTQESRDV